MLWGFGTAILLFGLLFAQTKTTDHRPDLVIWLIAATLLSTALVLGRVKQGVLGSGVSRGVGPISQVIIAGELLLCLVIIIDVLQHLHSL